MVESTENEIKTTGRKMLKELRKDSRKNMVVVLLPPPLSLQSLCFVFSLSLSFFLCSFFISIADPIL